MIHVHSSCISNMKNIVEPENKKSNVNDTVS